MAVSAQAAAVDGKAEADDSLDGLFDGTADSIGADAAAESSDVLLNKLNTREGPALSWAFDSSAGLSWDLSALVGPEALNGLIPEAGATAKSLIGIDIKPDSGFRFLARGGVRLDSTPAFGDFFLDELFVDVDLSGVGMLRIGQSRMAWGKGRIFSPANLAATADGVLNARLSLPTLAAGLTGLVAANPGLMPIADAQKLYVAGKLDLLLGMVDASLMASAQYDLGLSGALSLKTVLFGFEAVAEATLGYRSGPAPAFLPKAMVGIFKEWANVRFSMGLEYLFDAEDYFLVRAGYAVSTQRAMNHIMGLQAGWRNFLGEIDLAASWIHSFTESSGSFEAMLNIPLWNHVRLRIAVPASYGTTFMEYRDETLTDTLDGFELPRFGLILGINVFGQG
jgi:hypothetical protein